MFLTQEDQPRTHSTVREISRETGIPKSSVRHTKGYAVGALFETQQFSDLNF